MQKMLEGMNGHWVEGYRDSVPNAGGVGEGVGPLTQNYSDSSK